MQRETRRSSQQQQADGRIIVSCASPAARNEGNNYFPPLLLCQFAITPAFWSLSDIGSSKELYVFVVVFPPSSFLPLSLACFIYWVNCKNKCWGFLERIFPIQEQACYSIVSRFSFSLTNNLIWTQERS